MKSLIATVALALVLATPAIARDATTEVGEPFDPGRVVELEIEYPRVKREIFVPRADGKRDELQHLLYLAESPNTQRKRARGYRNLAEVLLKAGRGAEAMRAYKAGDYRAAATAFREIDNAQLNVVSLNALHEAVVEAEERLSTAATASDDPVEEMLRRHGEAIARRNHADG